MAADYGRNLYRQYEEELAKNERLAAENRAGKRELLALKKEHEAEISALRSEHKKEIKAIKDEYEAIVNKLLEKIERLTEEVRKLRAQIDKNSSNSSKPPSSDGFEKAPRNIPNGREKSGRKPGGQKGHRGNVPVLIENPDETIDLNKYTCECGGDVVYAEESVRKRERDIRISVHVKEYRAGKGVCLRCGKKTETAFPEGIHNHVSVGARRQSARGVARLRRFRFAREDEENRIGDYGRRNFFAGRESRESRS